MEDMTPGQVAFEAYRKNANEKTHDGRQIPEWSALGDSVRSSWEAAGEAIIEEILIDAGNIEVLSIPKDDGAVVEIKMTQRIGFTVDPAGAERIGVALIGAAHAAEFEAAARAKAKMYGFDWDTFIGQIEMRAIQ
jgi:hypothetical protein